MIENVGVSVDERMLSLGEVEIFLRDAGTGQPVLLLHGFPHTGEIWSEVEPRLVAAGWRVLTPDLRGMGRSSRPTDGYEARSLASDQARLLDELSLPAAHVVGFDAGAAAAFGLAIERPDLVSSLTLVEAVIGGLPGAEEFGAGPWWFGFHQVPGGLAEDVVSGSEDRYIRHFLQSGSRRGLPEAMTERLVGAFTGRDRLRGAFAHYRAMPANAAANKEWAEKGRLAMPVTVVGASTLRDMTARQLRPLADNLEEHLLLESAHIVPIDAAEQLALIIADAASRS